MELRNGLATETGWEFFEGALDPDQIATTGSSFMIGNGYLGYRGTLAEWSPDELVGCIVADTWDTASEGALTELCNVPNGLFLAASVDGVPVPVSGTHDFERRVTSAAGCSPADPAGGARGASRSHSSRSGSRAWTTSGWWCPARE